MGKKSIFLLFLIIIFVFLVGSVKGVRADLQLGDTLNITGFFRYELGIHTGNTQRYNVKMGLQTHRSTLELSRGMLVTELTWTPFCALKDNFKVFIKPRFSFDTTALWDKDIHKYNAYGIDASKYNGLLMKANEDNYRGEIWELYGDLKIGNFWLRAGRQQIVWGEMIGGRFLDQINPLDLSWNFNFEPEEFENIRIPTWMIRSSYLISQHFLDELSVEGFVNPVDFMATNYGQPGSPFNIGASRFGPWPPFYNVRDGAADRRGNTQYGARLGWQKFGIYGTFNYMHIMEQAFLLETERMGPDKFGPYLMDHLVMSYPFKDIIGMSLNYDIPYPWNLVFSFEGTWVPNQPYQDAKSIGTPGPIGIKDMGTFNHALRIEHNHQIFPSRFLGEDFSFTAFTFQVQGSVREGDHNDIKGPALCRIETNDLYFVGKITQPFHHAIWTPSFQIVYDCQHGYLYKPSIKYAPSTYWYADLTGVCMTGTDMRSGRMGYMKFTNEVFARITFQF